MRGPLKILIPVVTAFMVGIVLPGRLPYRSIDTGLKGGKFAAVAGEPSQTSSGQKATANAAFSCEQLSELLGKERLKLKEKEELLSRREGQVLAVQKQVEDRIAQLRTLRAEIGKAIEQRSAQEELKLSKLAKVYEATEPEEAGRLLSQLDVKLAAQLLVKISDAKAGKLWAYVKPEQAVKISEELYGGKAKEEGR